MDHYFTNNQDLKHDEKTITSIIGDTKLSFLVDSGVFSKDKVDFGTKFLLNTLSFNRKNGKLLDLGCGYGVIGIYLAKITDFHIDMVDVNERALNLTKRNIELNNLRDIRVFVSDAYFGVDTKYDVIVTNPPIRTGKKKIMEFLLGSISYLEPGGELWFVMRKDHGVKSIIKLMEEKFNVEVMARSKGFYVVRATVKNEI